MTDKHDKPSEVSAESGEVLIEGPGGIVLSMTPDAALRTGHRLLEAGEAAKAQKGEWGL